MSENYSRPTNISSGINDARVSKISSQPNNEENGSDDDYESFCANKEAEGKALWVKVLRNAKNEGVADIMATHISDPKLALDMMEAEIAKILKAADANKFKDDTNRMRVARLVRKDLLFKKAYDDKKKQEKQEQEKKIEADRKEKEKLDRTVANLDEKTKPVIRLEHIVEDLHKFEGFLSRKNFDGSMFLSLFLSCVDDKILKKTRKLVEGNVLDGLTWKECKKKLIELLTGKNINEFMTIFRRIRPRRGHIKREPC